MGKLTRKSNKNLAGTYDRKARPCRNHSQAYPSWNLPEVKGMSNHNIRFKKCGNCGWIIRDKMVVYKYDPNFD